MRATAYSTSILVFVTTALIVTYLFQSESDRAVPVGADSTLTIEAVPATLPKARILELLSSSADRAGINLYKIDVDRSNPDGARILHEFSGDLPARLGGESHEYPSFSRWFTTSIKPSSEIDREDMRGLYAIYGTGPQADSFLQELKREGIVARASQVSSTDILTRLIGGENPLGSVIVVATTGLVLGASTFMLRRREVSVARAVLGRRNASALLLDVAALLGVFTGAALGAALISVPVLWVWNGLNQFGPFISTYLAIVGLGAMAVLAGAVLVLLGFSRMRLPELVKGRKPWLTVHINSLITTGLAFGVAFAVVGSSASAVVLLNDESRHDSSWQKVGDGVTLRFAATTTAADFENLSSGFMDVYSRFERDGQAVLAKPPTAPALRPGDYGPYIGNSLVVNPEYLERNHILNEDGEVIRPPQLRSGDLLLLIPSAIWTDREKIVAEYSEWAEFQQELGMDDGTRVVARMMMIGSGQEHFNYGANQFAFGSSQFQSVIAVVSTQSEILPAGFFVSAASNGAVIFDDGNALSQALSSAGIEDHIAAIDSANGLALNDRAARVNTLLGMWMSGALLAIVLALSAAVLNWSYLERLGPVISARIVHGHGFFGRHSALFLTVVSIGVAALLLNIAIRRVDSFVGFALALGLLLAYCALAFATLRARERGVLHRSQAND